MVSGQSIKTTMYVGAYIRYMTCTVCTCTMYIYMYVHVHVHVLMHVHVHIYYCIFVVNSDVNVKNVK